MVTKEMICAAHDICLKKGDFVLSASLLERIYLAMRDKAELARWEASYNAVCDERDAIVKDNDKAHALLRQALAALEAALSDDQPYIVQSKEVAAAIKEFLE